MLEVLFDIPTLKKLYPELNRCFGFTYDDISNELTQVYAQKVFNLTQEEKELANQCKSDDGWGVDAVKFALATNENIAVAVPDSFNPATIMESYAAKLHNEESASCALLFMAALLYRGKITEAPISEGENDNMLYQQYIHEVRPDMLKLYIALNQPKQKNGKDFITDIKIAAGGNSPILINNKNSWLENRLNAAGIRIIFTHHQRLSVFFQWIICIPFKRTFLFQPTDATLVSALCTSYVHCPCLVYQP